jgi:hypothetical protein
MESTTITPNKRWNEINSRVKPKISSSRVKGKIGVTTTINRVAINRYFPGLLLKKGFRLRITSTISDAEITDSRIFVRVRFNILGQYITNIPG